MTAINSADVVEFEEDKQKNDDEAEELELDDEGSLIHYYNLVTVTLKYCCR